MCEIICNRCSSISVGGHSTRHIPNRLRSTNHTLRHHQPCALALRTTPRHHTPRQRWNALPEHTKHVAAQGFGGFFWYLRVWTEGRQVEQTHAPVHATVGESRRVFVPERVGQLRSAPEIDGVESRCGQESMRVRTLHTKDTREAGGHQSRVSPTSVLTSVKF